MTQIFIIQINTDGTCSFTEEFTEKIPATFPLTTEKPHAPPVAALFWADHDLSLGNGKIWFRASNDQELLDRATQDVAEQFASCAKNFAATYVYIITWENVTFNGATKDYVCINISNVHLVMHWKPLEEKICHI